MILYSVRASREYKAGSEQMQVLPQFYGTKRATTLRRFTAGLAGQKFSEGTVTVSCPSTCWPCSCTADQKTMQATHNWNIMTRLVSSSVSYPATSCLSFWNHLLSSWHWLLPLPTYLLPLWLSFIIWTPIYHHYSPGYKWGLMLWRLTFNSNSCYSRTFCCLFEQQRCCMQPLGSRIQQNTPSGHFFPGKSPGWKTQLPLRVFQNRYVLNWFTSWHFVILFLLWRICISQEEKAINLTAPASPGKLVFETEETWSICIFLLLVTLKLERLSKIR